VCHVQAAKRLADAEPGAICIGCVCDVTDAASCRSVAELARQRFGRVDVWVNNGTCMHACLCLLVANQRLGQGMAW